MRPPRSQTLAAKLAAALACGAIVAVSVAGCGEKRGATGTGKSGTGTGQTSPSTTPTTESTPTTTTN
jgi:hypothetical protein